MAKLKTFLTLVPRIAAIIFAAQIIRALVLTLFAQPSFPEEGLIEIVTQRSFLFFGPALLLVGISLSFIFKNRPAILRLETILGLLATFIMGVLGMFTVGIIYIIGGQSVLVSLIVDWIIWKIRRNKVLRNVEPQVIADTGSKGKFKLEAAVLLALFLIALVLWVIMALPPGFIPMVLILIIPFSLLLLIATSQYLENYKKIMRAFFAIAILLLAGLTFASLNRTDISAETTDMSAEIDEHGSSSFGGGGESGGFSLGGSGEGSNENLSIEFSTVGNTDRSFSLNGKRFEINKGTAVIFYGELENKNAYDITLTFEDGTDLLGKITDGRFFLQSQKPNAQGELSSARLRDKNKKTLLKEKIENHADERSEALRDARNKISAPLEELSNVSGTDMTIELDGQGGSSFAYPEDRGMSSGEMLSDFFSSDYEGSSSGSMGTQNMDLNYMTLSPRDRKGKNFKIALNKKIYVFEGNTRTVFYALVKQANAKYISIKLDGGTTVTGKIENKQFFIGTQKKMTRDAESMGMMDIVKSVTLLDRNKKKISTENLDGSSGATPYSDEPHTDQ